MAPVAKVKACFPCSSGKRKCDKAQPACTRCNDRDVECRYPPTKRKRPHASTVDVSNSPSISDSNEGPPTLTNIAFPSSAIDHVDPQEWIRSLGTLGAPQDDSSSSSASTGQRDATDFFLKPDAWIIRHIPFTTPTFPNEICMNYVRGIHDFFDEWVTNSHSSFMHRQLYADSGYPSAIQDAYACVALHNVKNAANENAIDDILAAKMEALLKSYPENDTGSENLDIREHLSRTQALYVHLVLCLFASSIGARASGEQHIQTLISWTQQLWEVAHHDPDICQSENSDGSATSANAIVLDAMFDGDTTPRLWRSWVLSESIRRIWLMATSTIGVYLTLRQKWAECHGGIYFTSRKDVWNAKSASAWAAACRKADPLFVCSLECESLFLTAKASDVDDLLVNMFTIMWGTERVENWVERTAEPGQVVKVWRAHGAGEK